MDFQTVALTLLVPAVGAGVKFLADVRRQLDGLRTLLLGFEAKGGGLLDQMRGGDLQQMKMCQDLDAAFMRIRQLENAPPVVEPTRRI